MKKYQFISVMLLVAIFLSACVLTIPEPVPVPTAAPDQNETFEETEHKNILVYTFTESGENEGRSELSVAYPITLQDAINERMAGLSQQFIDEYRNTAAEIEESYQKYKRETGEEAASFITHYHQDFDVAFANENIVSFHVVQAIGTGGTGNIVVTGYIFDRRTGAELTPSDLFVDDSYLEMLSDLTRVALATRIKNGELASDQEWIEQGTAPIAEHFDTVLFHADGTVRVMFDKYQVAAGVEGIVEVELPISVLADLLQPDIRLLLDTSE